MRRANIHVGGVFAQTRWSLDAVNSLHDAKLTNCLGIVDWNPCRSAQDSSGSSSHIVAVDSYVYVHCSSPGAGSYLMQCPGSTVWNPQANGCMEFGGHSQSPPHLIGPLTGTSPRPPGDVDRPTSTPGPFSPQLTQHPLLHHFTGGLPHSLPSSVSGPPTSLFRPSGTSSAGGLASQLIVNPCVLDDRGTLSPLRFHRHPYDPSKYLECVPAERSVIVYTLLLVLVFTSTTLTAPAPVKQSIWGGCPNNNF